VGSLSALAACGQGTPEKNIAANPANLANPPTIPPAKPQEKVMDRISRPPPPDVAPVEIDGVVYAQVLNARKLGLPNAFGYLKAEDSKTGTRQWVQKVYEIKINPADETDVQEVYFRSLVRVPGRRALRIENEAGAKFVVDLDTRQVTAEP
jgi:hypothetical protein